MYRRKGRQTEYQASVRRFLEQNKDPLKRLKALKHGHEKTVLTEVKEFYTEYHSTVFYVVYSSFCCVENSIQERVHKGKGYSEPHLKDLLELVLPSLERILVTLPELIHQRWQFNSICLVVRKLLHPENTLKLQQYGIKLLVLWLQALQENAGDACMELFASAVPNFPPQKTPMGLPVDSPSPSLSSLSLCERYGTYSSTSIGPSDSATPLISPGRSSSTFSISSRDVVCGNVLRPLFPASSRPSDHYVTLELMNYLLTCLTSQVGRLQWEDPSNHLRGFAFLFFLFKLFYLACLYKGFRTEAGLYTQAPPPELKVPGVKKEETDVRDLQSVQEEPDPDSEPVGGGSKVTTPSMQRKRRTSPYRMSSVIKLEYDLSNKVYSFVRHLILKYLLKWILPGQGDAKLPSLPPSPFLSRRSSSVPQGAELMRDMWFTSRDNVNLLLEICRHGFQLSTAVPDEVATLKRLADLYFTWVQLFDKSMHTTPSKSTSESTAAGGWRRQLEALTTPAELPRASAFSILPWEQLSGYEGYTPADVCAGTQAFVRMVIAHTSQVFLTVNTDGLSSQIEICKKLIRMYQEIAQLWIMDNSSWEYLLSVLLHLTLHLLKGDPPENRDTTLGGNLASTLLKTLFVCYLRASMVTRVSPALWDNLLAVLSSLTQWKEVVQQWQITMETMTEILAQTMYNLDLNNLPLNRLLIDDHPRNRPRIRTITQTELDIGRMSSFSHVHVISSKKSSSGTSPLTSKLASAGVGAGDKAIKGKLQKAMTEVQDESPPDRTYHKRLSTPTGTCYIPSSFSTPLKSIKERSISSGTPLINNLEPVVESPHSRSSLSIGVNILGDSEETCSPSVSHSLPTDVILSKNRPGYQHLVEEDDETETKESVIINPHVRTPSKIPAQKETQAVKQWKKRRTSESELNNRELEKKLKERERQRKLTVPAMDLVLQNRDYWSPEPETRTKTRSDSAGGGGAPQDLILKNESSRDSVTSDVDVTKDVELSGSAEVSELHSELQQPPPLPDADDEDQRLSFFYKSSSESDLRSHAVQLSTEGGTLSKDDTAHHRLRRASSGSSRKLHPKEASPRKTLDITRDPFSSSIIPHSHNTPVHSPMKTPPHSRVPRIVRMPAMDADHQKSPVKSGRGGGGEGGGSGGSGEGGGAQENSSPSPPPLSSDRRSPPRRGSGCTSPIPAPHTQAGWTPVVAAVVWQRMLKILGNINEIRRPSIHAEAMSCLLVIWKNLTDIEANSGISMQSHSTPPLPEFMPPMFLLAPWVFKACSLSSSYSKGRMIAYQILCEMTLKHWHTPPTTAHLFHFYRLMRHGFNAVTDENLMHTAVKSGCKVFSYGLAGSNILLSDCIQACTTILCSKKLQAPRTEALFLLGSMLFLPDLYPTVLLPGGEEVSSGQLKEKLIETLFLAAKIEPTRIARCLALYQIGMLAFSELRKGTPSMRLPEGVDILLSSLHFADRSVSVAGIDMLSLLVEVAPQMMQLYPSMTIKIIEAFCYSIAVFMTEELEHASWVDKVVVTLILCLRDWLMVLPIQQMVREGTLSTAKLNTVFEVLQAAAGSEQSVTAKRHAIAQLFTIRSPVSVSLEPLETTSSRTGIPTQSQSIRKRDEIRLSSNLLRAPLHPEQEDRVQIAARSVLTHLLNLLGHFPLGCGAAQMGSVVREYHDCPSLQHLDELSSDIFDSPRVQFFSFNDSAVITFVEIPTKLEGIPGSVMTASYQTRLIIRDVTGKYTWDSAVLYGPKPSSLQSNYTPSLPVAESTDAPVESLTDTLAPPMVPNYTPPLADPLQPPSWRTHINSDRDILEDLLKHIETTSPECLLYPGKVGLCEPAPVGGEGGVGMERRMVAMLEQHQESEQIYSREAFTLSSMCGEKAMAPCHFPSTFAFHHCRLFLSHLGMFAWSKRSHLDLLEKNNQLILELKHLDRLQAQSRQTYKVAVLYVSHGQEDKLSILSNTRGSRQFEEFVAGLGWEVNMETHAGYMGGLKREFCANCTLPYYATSSEEVLFHVSTRMPPKLEQKVRHLGNDEVHIVWSEHWRDYRRTIFKTQFADVLIIIYPLPSGLFRIQITKKSNIPHFGPLFDGALVDEGSLPSLVRATAINALRAQRNPLVGYRGRYEERLRNIQNIVERKMKSSYEEFSLNVMHPLESSTQVQHTTATGLSTPSPQKSLKTSSVPIMNIHSRHSASPSPRGTPPENKWSLSPKVSSMSSLLKLPKERTSSGSSLRPRSRTIDERVHGKRTSTASWPLRRNSSVPDNLTEVGKSREKPGSTLSSPKKGPSPSTSKSSVSSKLGFFRTSPIMVHHSLTNTESPQSHPGT